MEGFEFLPQVFVDQMEGKTQGENFHLSSIHLFIDLLKEKGGLFYMRASYTLLEIVYGIKRSPYRPEYSIFE